MKEMVLSLLDQQQIHPAEVAFGFSDSRFPENQVQQGDSKPKLVLSESDILSAINIVQNFEKINNK